jgi:hypothetical protein
MPEFLAKFYRRIETALGSGVMRRAPVREVDRQVGSILANSGCCQIRTSSQALLLREVARNDLWHPD